MTGNLHKRLVKLEGRSGSPTTGATYDLRLLDPKAVDFIYQFAFRPEDDCALADNIPIIADLLRQCEIEPISPGIRTILHVFPRGLQLYWRHQRFVNGEIDLPQGNYDFKNLTFTAQARFQILCEQNGWDPESEEAEIEPLLLWPEQERSELRELLDCAVPDSEKVARRWRNGGVGEV